MSNPFREESTLQAALALGALVVIFAGVVAAVTLVW